MTRSLRKGPHLRPDVAELSDDQLFELLHGCGLLSPFLGRRDLLQDAWEAHGDRLTREWIADHPGSRPFCWYVFVGVPTWGERQTTRFFQPLAPYRENWLTWGILHTHLVPPAQEGEDEYLARVGQLTKQERDIIGPIVPAVELFRRQYPELYDKLVHRLATN